MTHGGDRASVQTVERRANVTTPGIRNSAIGGWAPRVLIGAVILAALLSIGFVLFGLSFVLLFWNEGRTLRSSQAAYEARRRVRPLSNSTSIDKSLDGALVHLVAPLTVGGDRLEDAVCGLSGEGAVRGMVLRRYDSTLRACRLVDLIA